MYTITPINTLRKQTIVNMPDVCPITKCCNDIVQKMFTSDSLSMISEVRTSLYILLTHGVNAEDIVKRIFKIVIRNLVGWELQVIEITDDIELQLSKSSREFYHLENYVVKSTGWCQIILQCYLIKNQANTNILKFFGFYSKPRKHTKRIIIENFNERIKSKYFENLQVVKTF